MSTKIDLTTTNAMHDVKAARSARRGPQPTWWPGSAAYAWEARARGPISEVEPVSSRRPRVGAAAVVEVEAA